MVSSSPLLDLRNSLPEDSWKVIISALQQDDVVWHAIMDPQFRDQVISQTGSGSEQWSPIRIALLALESDLTIEEIQKTPLRKIRPSLYAAAAEAYSLHQQVNHPNLDLATAGLLALYIHETLRLENSWAELPASKHWNAPLVCLFGLLKSPLSLLQNISWELAVHVLLANPVSPEDQVVMLSALLAEKPTEQRLELLRILAENHPSLSVAVTERVWPDGKSASTSGTPRTESNSSVQHGFNSIQALVQTANDDIIQAEIHHLSGDASQAIGALNKAQQAADELNTTLAHRRMQYVLQISPDEDTTYETIWDEITAPPQLPVGLVSDLALSLLSVGKSAEPQLERVADSQDPTAQLALAYEEHSAGKNKTAFQYIQQLLPKIASLPTDHHPELVKLLLEIKRPQEAVEVIKTSPVFDNTIRHHAHLAYLKAEACAASGDYAAAQEAIQHPVILHPENLEFRRVMGRLYELSEAWPQAVKALTEVVQAQEFPQVEDYTSLAQVLLEAGSFKQVELICQHILEENAEDSVAFALLGAAYQRAGRPQASTQAFEKALASDPEHPLPWLLYARACQVNNDCSTAVSILRKATQSIAGQADLLLELGKIHHQSGAYAQALDPLEQARTIINDTSGLAAYVLNSQLINPLAAVQFALGHTDSALNTIITFNPNYRFHPDALRLQAEILTALGQIDEAAKILKRLSQFHPDNVDISLEFVATQLQSGKSYQETITILEKILELEPENGLAVALYADVHKRKGDFKVAYVAYQKALAMESCQEPEMRIKLSLGFGQSALEMGEYETALVVLQQAWQMAPQHLGILRSLAEAYEANQLDEKALEVGRASLEIAPLSIENTMWFARLAQRITVLDEALWAIQRALKIAPNRPELHLRLGELHRQIGDYEAACSDFMTLRNLQESTFLELHQAAQALIDLGKPKDALLCLDDAVKRCQSGESEKSCLSFVNDLIESYIQIDELQPALECIDQFLMIYPEEITLSGIKALILYRLDRTSEASQLVQEAIEEAPSDVSLRYVAALLHYSIGELGIAGTHAEYTIGPDISQEYATFYDQLALAAEIAAANLNYNKAIEILTHPNAGSWLKSENLDYLCLRAEMALFDGQEVDAARALTAAVQLNSNHPRTLALQARLTLRQGDQDNAQDIFLSGLEQLSPDHHTPSAILGLTDAALELHQWSTAVYLLKEAAHTFSKEPRIHLKLARALALRAEHQRLCDELKVSSHTPGDASISEFSYLDFEAAIFAASQITENQGLDSGISFIDKWRTRGQAVFQPSQEHAKRLQEIAAAPAQQAACLQTLRYSGQADTALEYAEELYQSKDKITHPGLLAQLALVFAPANSDRAVMVAQEALGCSHRQNNPALPIYYALVAVIAHQVGSLPQAIEALEQGLASWEEEPQWHAWMADLQQSADIKPSQEDMAETAADHLQWAIRLEPKNASHYLKLGKLNLQSHAPEQAIDPLEAYIKLLPDSIDGWLELARARMATNDYTQAVNCAQHALSMELNNPEALHLLAQANLEAGSAEAAVNFCQASLENDPDNAEILLLQAYALEACEQPREALQSFNAALNGLPKNISLILDHAELTQKALGAKQAAESLKNAQTEFPDDPLILKSLAHTLVAAQDYEEAVVSALQALQVNEGELDNQEQAHLLIVLGRVMRRQGQLDQSLHYLSTAIAIDPEMIEAYLELGKGYEARRQFTEALDVYHQAIRISPGDSRIYYQAGQTLKRIKDYAGAEEMLNRAARIAPNDAAIRRQLAQLVALNLVHNNSLTAVDLVEIN